jgi:hypothetical protein
MREQPTPDDRFIETASIGNDTVVRNEGIFPELNALAPPLMAAPQLRRAGQKWTM